MTTPPGVTATTHTMVRLDIVTGHDFAGFREAFEDAVPAFDLEHNLTLIGSGGTRADIEELTRQSALTD